MSEEHEEKKFKVTDRRKFTAEGEVREGAQEERPPEPPRFDPAAERRPSRPTPPPQQEERAGSEDAKSGGMDFSSFLLSIATTAMVHLGEIPDPATNRRHENPAVARQMIETLSMLQQKTKGNLSLEEANLLEDLLYELRMKYVAKSGGPIRL